MTTAVFSTQYFANTENLGEVIFIPGILSHGGVQVDPILSTLLERFGAITALTYTAEGWEPRDYARQVAGMAREFLIGGAQRVTLFGVSIGGTIAMMALDELTEDDLKKVRVIMVDTPYGSDTLVGLPPVAHWFFTRGVYRILNGPVGDWILGRMVSLPKDENIEVPSDLDAIEAAKYRQRVKDDAKVGLTGHKWRLWAEQIAWMTLYNGIPALEHRRTNSIVYFSCQSEKNDTVRQALATKRWKAALPDIRVITVPTAHAAFLEAAETWNKVLRKLGEEMS